MILRDRRGRRSDRQCGGKRTRAGFWPGLENLEDRTLPSIAFAPPVTGYWRGDLPGIPSSTAVADFNHDGRLDVALPNEPGVSLLFGDGRGGFMPAPGSPLPAPDIVAGVGAGDFNGDGAPDLAATFGQLSGPHGVTVLLNNGSGGFRTAPGYPLNTGAGTFPTSLAVGDFNGDRHNDIVVGLRGVQAVEVVFIKGDGSVLSAATLSLSGNPRSVAAADFNHDGQLDIAATSTNNTVNVLLGNGIGNFGGHIDSPAGVNPYGMAVGDYNGDGNPDLAVGDYGNGRSGNALTVLAGDGRGHFTTTGNLSAGPGGIVAAGDFNGDGKPDLAEADNKGIELWQGDGRGGFAAVPGSPFAPGNGFVTVGDFNGDGKTDLAAVNSDQNTISVLLNQSTRDVIDVTSRVGVHSRINRHGHRWRYRLTLTNASEVTLNNLKAVVLLATRKAKLKGFDGISSSLAPGRPFVGVAPSTLLPCQSATLTLVFEAPKKPRFQLLFADAPEGL